MMSDSRDVERLPLAAGNVAEKLVPPTTPATGRSPESGDLYALELGGIAAVQWLVVRTHPDDPGLLLLAPADGFPLVGRADVRLPTQRVGQPFVVRCGETCWIPAAGCPERLRTGSIPDDAVRLVRQKLAALARGILPTEAEATRAEMNPEYLDWLEQVAQARESLQPGSGQ